MSELQLGLGLAPRPPGPVYLITGGSGFLGRHLLRLLLEKEEPLAQVRVFDQRPDPALEDLSTDRTEVQVIQGDITDYDSVLEACRGADVVVHMASLVDVWHRVQPSLIHAVNVTGTENVIRACLELGIRSLVYTSSMEVIGPNARGENFIRGNEDTPYQVEHAMPYPRSKAAAERLVLEANGRQVKGGHQLLTCALRPTGIYGEGHDLMRSFYDEAVKRGGVVIGGVPPNSEHGRVYAGNVAWMHILAARALRAGSAAVAGEAFFCYDDSPYKSYEDFNMIFLSQFNFRRVRVPALLLWLLAVANDALRWLLRPVCRFAPLLNRYTLAVACTSFTVRSDKARRHFQYRPLFDWDQCRERTQSWVDGFPRDKNKDC